MAGRLSRSKMKAKQRRRNRERERRQEEGEKKERERERGREERESERIKRDRIFCRNLLFLSFTVSLYFLCQDHTNKKWRKNIFLLLSYFIKNTSELQKVKMEDIFATYLFLCHILQEQTWLIQTCSRHCAWHTLYWFTVKQRTSASKIHDSARYHLS